MLFQESSQFLSQQPSLPRLYRPALQPQLQILLQGKRTRPCHVAAVGMAANVRRDIRYLNPTDIIVALHHVVETVLAKPIN